jgi:8-oxo-dGTP pyrophosphatase MutT (NUDIX family)
MREETLLIVYRKERILLGYKNPGKKFGGKWNGWGGDVKPGETPEQSILREVAEETNGKIQVETPEKVGEILFSFETDEQDHRVHIFVASNYTGDLEPTEDFTEYREFPKDNLPEEMMPADRHWMPYLTQGKLFQGKVFFDRAFKNPIVNLEEVVDLI